MNLRRTHYLRLTTVATLVVLVSCSGDSDLANIGPESPSPETRSPINNPVSTTAELEGRVWLVTDANPPSMFEPNEVESYISLENQGRIWKREAQYDDIANVPVCYPRVGLLGRVSQADNNTLQLQDPTENEPYDLFLANNTLIINTGDEFVAHPPASISQEALYRPCSDEPTPTTPPGPPSNTIDFSNFEGRWESNGQSLFGPASGDNLDRGLVEFSNAGDFTVYNDLGDKFDAINQCLAIEVTGNIVSADAEAFYKVDSRDNAITRFEISRNGDTLIITTASGAEQYERSNVQTPQCKGREDFFNENASPLDDPSEIAGIWEYSLAFSDGTETIRYAVIDGPGNVQSYDFQGDSATGGENCFLVSASLASVFVPINEISWIEDSRVWQLGNPDGSTDNFQGRGNVFRSGNNLAVTGTGFSRELQPTSLSPDALGPICADGTSPGIPVGARPIASLEELAGQWQSISLSQVSRQRILDIDHFGYISIFDEVNIPDLACYQQRVDAIHLEQNTDTTFNLRAPSERYVVQYFLLDGILYGQPGIAPFDSSQDQFEPVTIDIDLLTPNCDEEEPLPENAVPIESIDALTGFWDITEPNRRGIESAQYLDIAPAGTLTITSVSVDPLNNDIACLYRDALASPLLRQRDNLFTYRNDNQFPHRLRAYSVENSILFLASSEENILTNSQNLAYPMSDPQIIESTESCPTIESLPPEKTDVGGIEEMLGVWEYSYDLVSQSEEAPVYIRLSANGDDSITAALFYERPLPTSGASCFEDEIEVGSVTEDGSGLYRLALYGEDIGTFEAFFIENNLTFANTERALVYRNAAINVEDIQPFCLPTGVPEGSNPITHLVEIDDRMFIGEGSNPVRERYITIRPEGQVLDIQRLTSDDVPDSDCFSAREQRSGAMTQIERNNFLWGERGIVKLYLSPSQDLFVVNREGVVTSFPAEPRLFSELQPLCSP